MFAQHVVHRRFEVDVQPRFDRQEHAPVGDGKVSPRGRELADPVVRKDENQDDEGLANETGTSATRFHVHAGESSRAAKMSLANGHCGALLRRTNHSLPRTSRNSGGGRRRRNAMVRSASSALA
jgi:hypothetical protein